MIVIGALAPGCVSQIHKLDPGWDGSYEPECTDSYAAVLGDTLAGSALLGIGLAAGNSASTGATGADAQATIAALGIAASLGFAIAAGIGNHEVRDCRRAEQAWQVGRVVAATQRDSDLARRPPSPAGVLQPARRGFYCAHSTTEDDISLCTRDRIDCDQARDAATIGVADLSRCEAADHAWCFAGHCYANEVSCERRRGPDGIGSCDEIE